MMALGVMMMHGTKPDPSASAGSVVVAGHGMAGARTIGNGMVGPQIGTAKDGGKGTVANTVGGITRGRAGTEKANGLMRGMVNG